MSLFTFTPSDVKKGKILDAGWYTWEVKKFKIIMSKKGQKLFFYTCEGRSGDAQDVPVDIMFMEQFPQFLMDFLKQTTDAEFSEEQNTQIDLTAPVGKFFEGYCEPKSDQNDKIVNNISQYRKVSEGSEGPGSEQVPF